KSEIYLVDFSFPMLDKARQRKYKPFTSFILAEAKKLPYKHSTFDLITISFAIRNLNTRKDILFAHLEEFYRVLKPGGTFINVETSQPTSSALKKSFHFYIKTCVRPIGSFISGSSSGYRYLAYTIPRFYSADELSIILKSVGFSQVDYKNKLGGIAAIHEAVK
ncbi:MAG: class I SAM-dependent methyltransferase, partial [Candidatus Aminicenantes bacterium]|nr:class I SAM-dependent methyltransferase [Candidatus Aminicenantes bacterium]